MYSALTLTPGWRDSNNAMALSVAAWRAAPPHQAMRNTRGLCACTAGAASVAPATAASRRRRFSTGECRATRGAVQRLQLFGRYARGQWQFADAEVNETLVAHVLDRAQHAGYRH